MGERSSHKIYFLTSCCAPLKKSHHYFTYAFVMMSATGKKISKKFASPAKPRKVRKIKMSCKAAYKRDPPKEGVKVPPQGWELFYKEMDEEMARIKTVVSEKKEKNTEQKKNYTLFRSDTEELFGSDDSDSD